MFLSKRSNGIYHIYYLQENGKRTSVSTKTKIKSEALKFLANFSYHLKEKEKRKFEPIDLKSFSKLFLKYSESVHTWKTTLDYRTTLNFMLKFFSNPQLSDFTPKMISDFLEHRIRKVSVYVARKDLINIKAMLNKAVQFNFLAENPSAGIKRIKTPEKQPIFFPKAEFEKLLKNIDINDIKDLVIFAVNTGLRQMELLTLEWQQIDLVNNLLILNNQNHLTKNKKIRNIPLNKKTIQILRKRGKNKNGKLVFTLAGNPIKQDFLVHKFKKYVLQAELNPKLNFHSLRHTFASWLVQKGESIYKVSKLLGHASTQTTEIYSHLRNDDLRSSVKLLES